MRDLNAHVQAPGWPVVEARRQMARAAVRAVALRRRRGVSLTELRRPPVVEVSRRVDRRLEAVSEELRRVAALIGRKSWPGSYAHVLAPLAIALARVNEARQGYQVPLLAMRGLP